MSFITTLRLVVNYLCRPVLIVVSPNDNSKGKTSRFKYHYDLGNIGIQFGTLLYAIAVYNSF